MVFVVLFSGSQTAKVRHVIFGRIKEGEDGHAGPTTKEKAEAILAEAMIAVRNFDNSNIQ